MNLTLSAELQAWLKRNQSKAIQAGVDSDFNRMSTIRTRIDAADIIEDGDPGSANVEEP